jgi:hypothetical protein
MLTSRARVAARRIAAVPRPTIRSPPLCHLPATRITRPSNIVRSIGGIRSYASGRPHPPGGTHKMNMSGEPEKAALEEFGVDLTERARNGKLDRSRWRDPADDTNPLETNKEQPCCDWASWHRQDGHYGRAGSAHRQGRRARVNQG